MRSRFRILEAMAWLALAQLLIRCVSLRYWRNLVGRVTALPSKQEVGEINFRMNGVVRAVISGAHHLPFESRCLPRAIAVQWMLRRRGQASSLVFGITRGAQAGHLHDLHAWVEVNGRTVIGDSPEQSYHRGLVLVQP